MNLDLPRVLILLVFLAVIPVLLFTLQRAPLLGWVSIVSVALIGISVYLLFGGSQGVAHPQ